MKVLVIESGNASYYHVIRSMAREGHDVDLIAGNYCRWHRLRHCREAHASPCITNPCWGEIVFDEDAACRQTLAS